MAVTQFIGPRQAPLWADPVEWNTTRTYEPYTFVTYQGDSYCTRQTVPVGIDITNGNYWVKVSDFNAQATAMQQSVLAQLEANETDVQNMITTAQNTIDTDIANANTSMNAQVAAVENVKVEINKNQPSVNFANYITDVSADITDAFNTACAYCVANNRYLFIPNGTYYHDSTLTVPAGLTVIGESHEALFVANDYSQAAIILKSNTTLSNIGISNSTDSRKANDESAGILITSANNVIVDHVSINKTNSGGILVLGSTNIYIQNNLIQNTLADGIHITNVSKYCYVIHNSLYNIGDDMLAAIGYNKNADTCKYIYFIGNFGDTTPARAATMLGVSYGVMSDNVFLNYATAAIYFNTETQSYNLRKSDNIVISNSIYYSPDAQYCVVNQYGNALVNNCKITGGAFITYSNNDSGIILDNCALYEVNFNALGSCTINNCYIECLNRFAFNGSSTQHFIICNNRIVETGNFNLNRICWFERAINSKIENNYFVNEDATTGMLFFYDMHNSSIKNNTGFIANNVLLRQSVTVSRAYFNTTDNIPWNNDIFPLTFYSGTAVDHSVTAAVGSIFYDTVTGNVYMKTAEPNTIIKIGGASS